MTGTHYCISIMPASRYCARRLSDGTYSERKALVGETFFSATAGATRGWRLIGRAGELERVAGARAAGVGGCAAGGAGVGKSRLARAALAAAEQAGAATVWVQATRSAASVPLGAFASVIPARVRSDDLFELLRGAGAALGELAGVRPLVVGVDDAQLLDPVLRRAGAAPRQRGGAFVLATVRTGRALPRRDRLVVEGRAARSGSSSRQLDEARPPARGEHRRRSGRGGCAPWVWETSRGNPLYVRELMLGALAGGALKEVSGLWRMPKRPPLSASLIEAISARLAGLTSAELRVLELLALGEPLAVGELVELAGSEPAAAIEARGLIAAGRSGRRRAVRLPHPLYGEAIRAGLASLRARELRLALAAMVEARGAPSAPSARCGSRAGGWTPARRSPRRCSSTRHGRPTSAAIRISAPSSPAERCRRRRARCRAATRAVLIQVRKRFAEAESRARRDRGEDRVSGHRDRVSRAARLSALLGAEAS